MCISMQLHKGYGKYKVPVRGKSSRSLGISLWIEADVSTRRWKFKNGNKDFCFQCLRKKEIIATFPMISWSVVVTEYRESPAGRDEADPHFAHSHGASSTILPAEHPPHRADVVKIMPHFSYFYFRDYWLRKKPRKTLSFAFVAVLEEWMQFSSIARVPCKAGDQSSWPSLPAITGSFCSSKGMTAQETWGMPQSHRSSFNG